MTGKKQVDKKVTKLELKVNGNNKKYQVEAIWDNTIYANEAKVHLPNFYHIVIWISCLIEKNSLKPILLLYHLRKLNSLFYNNHP